VFNVPGVVVEGVPGKVLGAPGCTAVLSLGVVVGLLKVLPGALVLLGFVVLLGLVDDGLFIVPV
jgi:hypothetical protein